MDLAEFRHEMDLIALRTLSIIERMAEPYQHVDLSYRQWENLLYYFYPVIEDGWEDAAEIGREFYDSERVDHLGDTLDTFLENFDYDVYIRSMKPAFRAFSSSEADETALAAVLSRAERQVENGARRTIIRAVRNDPVVKGWARVATGRETCSFCLMLVSRGPVFTSAESAGLAASDASAEKIYAEVQATGDDSLLKELMNRWHPNCDCMVVPVYDRRNWPGYSAWKEAEELWKSATQGYSGRDALNAFRRAVERGNVDLDDLAAA